MISWRGTAQPLGARVPGHHATLGVDHEHRVVLNPVDQKAQARVVRRARQLAIVNVGVDADPAHDRSAGVADGIDAREEPTKHAVAPAQRKLHLERRAALERALPALHHLRQDRRVVDSLRSPALQLLEALAGVRVPASPGPRSTRLVLADHRRAHRRRQLRARSRGAIYGYLLAAPTRCCCCSWSRARGVPRAIRTLSQATERFYLAAMARGAQADQVLT